MHTNMASIFQCIFTLARKMHMAHIYCIPDENIQVNLRFWSWSKISI